MKHYLLNSINLSFRISHNIQNIFPINVNNLSKPVIYLLVINFILHFSFTRSSKGFSAISICLYHTSNLRVKVIFINLLWKIFEIHKIIKAITKEMEPVISSPMYPYTFALQHNYCLRIQSLVWNEVYTTYWCHILDFSEFFIMSGWLGQCHYEK